MPLSRITNFTPGSTIQSGQVDAEFDQIIGLLAGTTLSTVLLKSSSAGDATLTVDNTGGGKVVEWRVNGSAKAKVNPTGQLESLLATGTAPLVVASTTAVTNLNADLLDGLHSSSFVTSMDPSVVVNGGGNSQLDLERAGGKIRLTNNATGLVVTNVDSAATLLTLDKGASKAVTVYGVLKGITPVAAEDLTRKDYVDAAAAAAQADAMTVSGLDGGTNGMVVRYSSGTTWADAVAGDAPEFLECLLFKMGGKYYRPNSVITGLSGLVAGTNYYLNASTSPQLGSTPLDPSTFTQVFIGKALSTTSLFFSPGRPYTE
jgi:hypothetical protein